MSKWRDSQSCLSSEKTDCYAKENSQSSRRDTIDPPGLRLLQRVANFIRIRRRKKERRARRKWRQAPRNRCAAPMKYLDRANYRYNRVHYDEIESKNLPTILVHRPNQLRISRSWSPIQWVTTHLSWGAHSAMPIAEPEDTCWLTPLDEPLSFSQTRESLWSNLIRNQNRSDAVLVNFLLVS